MNDYMYMYYYANAIHYTSVLCLELLFELFVSQLKEAIYMYIVHEHRHYKEWSPP